MTKAKTKRTNMTKAKTKRTNMTKAKTKRTNMTKAKTKRTAKRTSRRPAWSGSAHVWIVEMMSDSGRWCPTVGCRLEKPDARNELADWKKRNPSDRFRLMRYAPNDKVSDALAAE
jgi:hypothetical protein